MVEPYLKAALEWSGAVTHGHYRLRAGLHTDTFIDLERLFKYHQEHASVLCNLVALYVSIRTVPVDLIIGPAEGGKLVAECVAAHLGHLRGMNIPWTYAEKKQTGGYRLRSHDQNRFCDKRVLVVDDVMTSGGSLLQTSNLVSDQGGIVSGIAALCNRGRVASEFNTPFFYSVLSIHTHLWSDWECELCASGTPLSN